MPFEDISIVVKGGGEMASGVAVRLYRAGFRHLLLLESPAPLAVRRTVSFCEAVYDTVQRVEGIAAQLVKKPEDVSAVWAQGRIAVLVDPQWHSIKVVRPEVVVDAVIAKRNLGTCMSEAPLVVALGPGFTAGKDVHAVIESQRGHNLGRVYYEGEAEPNTGIPGNIGGHTLARVLRAPCAGIVQQAKALGDAVRAGDVVCTVGDCPVTASIDGVLRGAIRPGIAVAQGTKIGDVDPRGEADYCFSVSEKARALGGAVLEAVCSHVSASPRLGAAL